MQHIGAVVVCWGLLVGQWLFVGDCWWGGGCLLGTVGGAGYVGRAVVLVGSWRG